MKTRMTTRWGVPLSVVGRDGKNDQNTLISCITEDEYGLARLPDIPDHSKGIAVDLGAHIGGVTLPLAAMGYFVHAVEMFPENVELIKQNLELNSLSNQVLIHQTAIGGQRKKNVPAFYANTKTEPGDVHEFIGTILPGKSPAGSIIGGGKTISVPMTTLDDLFEEQNIDVCEFLKIDIEGAEWQVIRNTLPSTLDRVKRIAVELEGLGGEVSTGDFLKLLPKSFRDASEEYFPKWCKPGEIVHGYFINTKYE